MEQILLGMLIGGSGVAVGSLFNLLGSLLKNRFDFNKIADRRTFVSLNCAFYDLRLELERSGIMDIKTKGHEKDYDLVREYLKEMNTYLINGEKDNQIIEKWIVKNEQDLIKNESPKLYELRLKASFYKREFSKELMSNDQSP